MEQQSRQRLAAESSADGESAIRLWSILFKNNGKKETERDAKAVKPATWLSVLSLNCFAFKGAGSTLQLNQPTGFAATASLSRFFSPSFKKGSCKASQLTSVSWWLICKVLPALLLQHTNKQHTHTPHTRMHILAGRQRRSVFNCFSLRLSASYLLKFGTHSSLACLALVGVVPFNKNKGYKNNSNNNDAM